MSVPVGFVLWEEFVAKLVVYSGATLGTAPKPTVFTVEDGSFTPAASPKISNLRRVEFHLNDGQPALVIEPYFGESDNFDSVLKLNEGGIDLTLRSLLWLGHAVDGKQRRPLLANLGGTAIDAFIRITPASFRSLEDLARAFGLTPDPLAPGAMVGRRCAVIRRTSWTRRLAPELTGCDGLDLSGLTKEELPAAKGDYLQEVRLRARIVRAYESTGAGDALLLVLEAAPPSAALTVNAGVFNRYGRSVSLVGRVLRQIQAADVLRDFDAKKVGRLAHWIELAQVPGAALIEQAVVAPLRLALNGLRGSSGLSFVPNALDEEFVLRWRVDLPHLLKISDSISAESFKVNGGFALRCPPRLLTHGASLTDPWKTWMLPLVSAHNGKALRMGARPLNGFATLNPNGGDLLDSHPEVQVRKLVSSDDFGPLAPSILLGIGLSESKQTSSVRVGSLDINLQVAAKLDTGSQPPGGFCVAELNLRGFRIGYVATEDAAVVSARMSGFDLRVSNLTPGTDDPLPDEERAGFSTREPLLLINHAHAKASSDAARLQVEETWQQGRDRSFVLSLTPGAKPLDDLSLAKTLLIDPDLYFISQLEGLELLNAKSGRVNEEIAYYTETANEGPRWQMVWNEKAGRKLRLPPQVLGEEMEKGGLNRSSTIVPGKLVDYRLSPPATLTVRGSTADQNLQEALWNWRRVFGYPGQRRPGAEMESATFELVYGMQTTLDGRQTAQRVRWVEAFARRGEFSPGLGENLTDFGANDDLRRVARHDYAENWLRLQSGLRRRPAALELEIDGQRANDGEAAPRAVLEQGVSYSLRKEADLAYPCLPVPTSATETNAPLGTLKGGVGWPFESRSIYEEVWAKPLSDAGTIAEPVLTALGGYGEYKASFANGKTLIRGRTSLGRSELVATERIGRIAGFWNRAKHVIVYERSTLPSEQMRCEQPRHTGRPILRKVEEYVEILQPERLYPENGQAPEARAFLRGLRFISTRIPVLSRWGQDTADGLEVPLWNAQADPRLYPKPQVRALLLGEPDADLQQPTAALSDPQNLYFFSSTNPALNADTDHWPAFAGIDFIDRPAPAPDLQAPLPVKKDPKDKDEPDPNPDLQIPAAELIPPGFERVSHRLEAANGPANLLSERGSGVLSARPGSITVIRGRAARSVAGAEAEAIGKLLQHTELAQQAQELTQQIIRFCEENKNLAQAQFDKKYADLKSQAQQLSRRADATATGVAKLRGSLDDWARKLKNAEPICAGLKAQARRYLDRQRIEFRHQIEARTDAWLDQLSRLAVISIAEARARADEAVGALSDLRRQQLMEPLARSFGYGFESLEVALADVHANLHEHEQAARALYDELSQRVETAIGNAVQLRLQVDAFRKGMGERLNTLESKLPGSVPSLVTPALSALRRLIQQSRSALDELDRLASEAPNDAPAIRAELKKGRDYLFEQTGLFALAREGASFLAAVGNDWLAASQSGAFKLDAWADGVSKELRAAIDAAAKGEFIAIADLRDEIPKRRSLLLATIDAAFEKGAQTLDAKLEQLCASFGALLQPLGELAAASGAALDQLSDELRDRLEKLTSGTRDQIAQVADRAERWLDERSSGLRDLVDSTEDALKRLRRSPTFADPDSTLRMIRAAGEGPILPQISFNRDRIAYFFDDARKSIETSPVAALVNRAGDELKAFGLRVPTKEMLEQLVPASLQDFDLSKILPDFAGVRSGGLFPIKFPDVLPEQVKVKHGFDKEAQTAWLSASVDIDIKPTTVFKISVLELKLTNAKFLAHSKLVAGLDGVESKTAEGSISGDWTLEISGKALMSFRKTTLRFTDGKLKFELKPENIELNELIRWISDAVKAYGGGEDDGLRLELIDADLGIPKGLRALLDLPVPVTGYGAVTIMGLSLGARFELRVSPKFSLGVGINIASEKMPFTIFISFLGGGGWLDAQADYVPSDKQLTSVVTLGISAGAGAGLNFGPMRGSVMILLSVYGRYHSGAHSGAGLTLALSLLVRGHATIWGWLHIDVVLLLVVTYRPDRSLIGTGSLSVTVRISRFFKVSFSTGFTYVFKGSGANKAAITTPREQARGRIARSA